jgi:hypothetical protein
MILASPPLSPIRWQRLQQRRARSTAISSRPIALSPNLPHQTASSSLPFAEPPPVTEGINCPGKLSECAVWAFHGTQLDFHTAGWMDLSVRDALGTDADGNRNLTNST